MRQKVIEVERTVYSDGTPQEMIDEVMKWKRRARRERRQKEEMMKYSSIQGIFLGITLCMLLYYTGWIG